MTTVDSTVATEQALRSEDRPRRVKNALVHALLLSSISIAIAMLVVLLVYIVNKGWPRLNADLFNRFPSSLPARAGARSAIWGTIWIVSLTALFCLPVGIGAAVYLEEFADRNRWWVHLIEVNIQNLAAVPSIVYGILGLGFIVRGPLGLGPTVLAAGLTLSLLVLPIVIIASREAIRAVPDSLRQGALALGATPLQAVRTQVLPSAVPGIATGAILALSRAIGEAAPLLLVGGITFITFTPTGLDSSFTALPIQIFNWISRPQEEFKVVAAAAIIVLIVILLAMNSVAIWLRNRYERRR
jgi:phosphate transport system permease protein